MHLSNCFKVKLHYACTFTVDKYILSVTEENLQIDTFLALQICTVVTKSSLRYHLRLCPSSSTAGAQVNKRFTSLPSKGVTAPVTGFVALMRPMVHLKTPSWHCLLHTTTYKL